MGSRLGGAAALLLQTVSLTQTRRAMRMKIKESLDDYREAKVDEEERAYENRQETARQQGAVGREGVASLKEAGRQSAFESYMAVTQAERGASAIENRLGQSGVRASGSPLLAAQQDVDLQFAAADRIAESGSKGLEIGGIRLGSQLQGIKAQGTLAANEYTRRLENIERKRSELEGNEQAMLNIALLGGAATLASSFYTINRQTPLFTGQGVKRVANFFVGNR